jgi:uncharacterized protein YjiK
MFNPPSTRSPRSAFAILASLVGVSSTAVAAPPTAVDLASYVRVGRYDLPEPTRSTAPAGSLLAQEVSGVTYNWDTDTLFVIGDGGTSLVQVSKNGQLIDSMSMALGSSPQGTEFYDTEGLTYVGNSDFVVVEERYRQVNLLTYIPGETLQRVEVQTVKIGTTVGNVGLEGLSWDPATGGFIFVKEKNPQSIFTTAIDFNTGTATNGSPTSTASTNLFNPGLASVLDMSDVFALSNLPSLFGQPDYERLLLISQESGQILNLDRSGNVSSRLTITADPGSPLSVTDMTMEGVTMDRDGNLYVVSESGGGDANHPQLWVYQASSAPNFAPTGVTLVNSVGSIPENTSTAAAVKVADLAVADDGLGANTVTIVGPDAAYFEVIGIGVFLKAGTVLNRTAKPNYSITLSVDDVTVGTTPDATVAYGLTIAPPTPGAASFIVSEVAPWSSGDSTLAADWFELTNVGTATATLTGWKMDDNSNSFGSAVTLTGVTSIAPGESVIFVETSSATIDASFKNLWFGASAPANLQVGRYSGSGVGLSTGGDAVNVYNSTGVLQANVSFGASPTGTFRTFDNAAGLNNTSVTTLSQAGINGAFIAANHPTEVGSPGTLGAPPEPTVSIVATDAAAAEDGGAPGTFRVSRTGSTVGLLTVNYTVATGAGRAGSDDCSPTLTGTVTIPAGQSFVDVTLVPVADGIAEGPELLMLTLGDTGSYDVTSPASATITIADGTAAVSVPALPPFGLMLCLVGLLGAGTLVLARRRVASENLARWA